MSFDPTLAVDLSVLRDKPNVEPQTSEGPSREEIAMNLAAEAVKIEEQRRTVDAVRAWGNAMNSAFKGIMTRKQRVANLERLRRRMEAESRA